MTVWKISVSSKVTGSKVELWINKIDISHFRCIFLRHEQPWMPALYFLGIRSWHSAKIQFCRCPGQNICLNWGSPCILETNFLGIHFRRSGLLTSNAGNKFPGNPFLAEPEKSLNFFFDEILPCQPAKQPASQPASKPASQQASKRASLLGWT